jgi:hypothetical protein
VAPIRVLEGPDTGFSGARYGENDVENVAIDPLNNVLVAVAERRILIFDRTAKGNTKPLRIIEGPKTGFTGAGGPRRSSGSGFIAVWSIHDNGDVPPRWRIGGPGGPFLEPRGVTVNPRHQEIIATDKRLNAVFTFHFPEFFEERPSPSTASRIARSGPQR